MHYLVTGATGFIGRALVDVLLSRGDSVTYLGRTRNRSMDSRAAFFCWNPAELPPLNAVPRHDAIIHLAGESVAQRWTPEVKRRIASSRIEGTRRLVAAVRELQHKPAVLVSASAIGYYGDRGSEVLNEASAPGRGFLAEICVAWEHEAIAARDAGLRVVPVRIATVLGPGGGALKKMLPAFRCGLGARFGTGAQWMSWIHVHDLVELLVFAASAPALDRPLNASSPNPVTNAEFSRTLAAALHRPAFLAIPEPMLRLALGEMSTFLLQSLRVLPEAAQEAGFRFSHTHLDEALRSALD